MIEMETIRKNLQNIRWHYQSQALMGRYYPNTLKGYPDEFVKIIKEYERLIDKAPVRLRLAYVGLYRCFKTQKIYAAECSVSEKYVQILHKRIIVYLFENLNKEHKK